MAHYPELLLDPTIPWLPRYTPPAPKPPRRRLLALLLVVLAAGFVGGTFIGALIGRQQAAEAVEAAEREGEVARGVVLDLQNSVDFWREQALDCRGYEPQRKIPEGGAI